MPPDLHPPIHVADYPNFLRRVDYLQRASTLMAADPDGWAQRVRAGEALQAKGFNRKPKPRRRFAARCWRFHRRHRRGVLRLLLRRA